MLYLNYMKKARKKMDYKFNFNKCCIWIIEYYKNNPDAPNLTLTNVVFEFLNMLKKGLYLFYLTLTNVVFEWWWWYIGYIHFRNLTLTNVVFE